MNKKLLTCFLVMSLALLLIVPSTFAAASITWAGVRTDTMTTGQWDTTMPTLTDSFVPLSGSAFYPAYSDKPTKYLQFKVKYSGVDYPFYLFNGVNKLSSTLY